MKLLMVLGGLIGFGMGLLLGLAQGSAWPGVFWRASVTALLAGLVLRWWGRVWLRNWRTAHRERAVHEARSAASAGPAIATPAPGAARV